MIEASRNAAPAARGLGALHARARVGVFSGVLLRSPFPETLLGAGTIVPYPDDAQAGSLDAVMGWGLKPGAELARAYARRHGLAFFRAEDAFLRSVRLGVQGEGPMGVCLDDVGMYYDARGPSRLEQLIENGEELDDATLRRARACIEAICAHGLSKYNWWATERPPWRDDRERVLVVDQTAGDLSIVHGLASPDCFERMVDDALANHPNAEVVVKVHPDVLAGHKQGHLEHLSDEPRVRLLADPINPIRLVEQVTAVYVATSQLGFEALMVGREVHCYGVPFYAGWGLTHDRVVPPRRNAARTLEQVFHAAYMRYPRFAHPETGDEAELEDAIEYLAQQRAFQARNEGNWTYRRVPPWHRCQLRRASEGPRSTIRFVSDTTKGRGERQRASWVPSAAELLRLGRSTQKAPYVAPGPLDAMVPPRGPVPRSFVRGLPNTSATSVAFRDSSDRILTEATAVLELLQGPYTNAATRDPKSSRDPVTALLHGEACTLEPGHPLAFYLDDTGLCTGELRIALVADLLVDWPLYASLRTGRPCSCLTALRERIFGVPRVIGLPVPPPGIPGRIQAVGKPGQ